MLKSVHIPQATVGENIALPTVSSQWGDKTCGHLSCNMGTTAEERHASDWVGEKGPWGQRRLSRELRSPVGPPANADTDCLPLTPPAVHGRLVRTSDFQEWGLPRGDEDTGS